MVAFGKALKSRIGAVTKIFAARAAEAADTGAEIPRHPERFDMAGCLEKTGYPASRCYGGENSPYGDSW